MQVRRAGIYRAATFPTKREAKDWAAGIESQAHHIAAGGFAPVPKASTLADLIDKYTETAAKFPGRTKTATLAMLRLRLGKQLSSLSSSLWRFDVFGRIPGMGNAAADPRTLGRACKAEAMARKALSEIDDELFA